MRELPNEVKQLLKSDPSRSGPEPGCGTGRFGAFLQAVSAAKTGGLFLVLGPKDGLFLAWLMAGLPNDSRLIAVTALAAELSAIRAALDTDLRVAFHHQDPDVFLRDIEHHRFDLIYCDLPLPAKSAALLHSMLLPGGVLMCHAAENPVLVTPNEDQATLLELYQPTIESRFLSLYVKGGRVLKRRGARRANAGRRPRRGLSAGR